MLDDFKKFLMRGNILDLAVAVVIGGAFGAVITSFVDNILMQLIGAVGGEPSFDAYSFTLNGSEIRYGSFLTALVSFVIIAGAIFLLLKGIEKAQSLRPAETVQEEAAALSTEELLVEIRDELRAQRNG